MNILKSIKSMVNEVNRHSSMGTQQAWALEFVSDLAIRVINTDAVNYEYSVTDGNDN